MSLYDELDEFLATESGDEYMTEGVVGLKAWKAYFKDFKPKYREAWKDVRKAEKEGDKKAFDKAIGKCKALVKAGMDQVDSIEENGILNIIAPLILGPAGIITIVQKALITVTSHRLVGNHKTVGNYSKQAFHAAFMYILNELDHYQGTFADNSKVKLTESAIAQFTAKYVAENGSISEEDYNDIRSMFEAASKDDDSDEDDSDGNDDDKGDDSDDDSDDGEKDEKLSKKAQEVMDSFNDLSDKDQETVKKLMQEHADDDDSTFMAYLEAAIEVVSENSSDSYTMESAIDMFDFPDFTSFT